MPIIPAKPSIVAVSAIVSIVSELAPSVQLAAKKLREVVASAIWSVGADTGIGKKASDTRGARPDIEQDKMRLSMLSAVSVLNAGWRILDALMLTILTALRSSGRNIVNIRQAFALRYGSAKWEIFRCFVRIATGSRHGLKSTEIACERIENAQRQLRMFA